MPRGRQTPRQRAAPDGAGRQQLASQARAAARASASDGGDPSWTVELEAERSSGSLPRSTGWGAILGAVEAGDVKATAHWLNGVGDINATIPRKNPFDGNRAALVTMLMSASGNGHLKLVEMLLFRGASVNLQDAGGYSALMLAVLAVAAGKGRPDLVRVLLRAGADVQLCFPSGKTVLESAVHTKCPKEVISMIEEAEVEAGSTPPPPDAGWYALIDAVHADNVKAAAAWLDAGGDVNATISIDTPRGDPRPGVTMLMHASSECSSALVAMLIERGANIHLRDAHRQSALMRAVTKAAEAPQSPADPRHQLPHIVRQLLHAGAGVQLVGQPGLAVLDHAATTGCQAEVFSLVEKAKKVVDASVEAGSRAAMFPASAAGWEAVREAVGSGDVRATARWLDVGGNVNSTIFVARSDGKVTTQYTMLMRASAKGHHRLVELLLQRGANVNLQDSDGNSALIFAVVAMRKGSVGNLAIVRGLLRAGADVQLSSAKGWTAVEQAVKLECPKEVAAMLVAAVPTCEALTKGTVVAMPRAPGVGWYSVGVAVFNGDVQTTVAWLDTGGDVNSLIGMKWPDGKIVTRTTMLMLASTQGHIKLVELLIKRGAKVNLQDSTGTSALHTALGGACTNFPGTRAVLRELLRAGADVHMRDLAGRTAIDFAVNLKCPKEIMAWLEGSATLKPLPDDAEANWLAIYKAVASGDLKRIIAWLDAGGDVDSTVHYKINTGTTMLMQASSDGLVELVELLLQRKANVNMQDSAGKTALMDALISLGRGGQGKFAIVRLLLNAGTDVQLRNARGWTALETACHFKCPTKVIGMLQAAAAAGSYGRMATAASGAGSDASSSDWYAVRDAVKSGDATAIKAWLDAGGEVDATIETTMDLVNGKKVTGCTMLMRSSVEGHMQIVELLLERGANVNLQDSEGMCALIGAVVATGQFQRGQGKPAIVSALLRAGADVQLCSHDGWSALDCAVPELMVPKEVVAMLEKAGGKLYKRANEQAEQLAGISSPAEDAERPALAPWFSRNLWRTAAEARADAAMAALLAEEEQKPKQKGVAAAEAPKSKKAKKKAKKKKGGGASVAGHSGTAAEPAADSSSEDDDEASGQSSSREAEAKAAREQVEATAAAAKAAAAAEAAAQAKAEEEAEWERRETARAIAEVAAREKEEANTAAKEKAEAETAAKEKAEAEAAAKEKAGADAVASAKAELEAQAAEVQAMAAVEAERVSQLTAQGAAATSGHPAMTLADVGNLTGRNDAPESTIGGDTTCIVCMVGAKTHLAVPCGHQSLCASCSANIKACPYCRQPAMMWVQARIV